mmetsp:Transcript_80477/g.250168  ORF Transcript_80477/g.250168 Transcript_80477/m.250168 type:complete len:257 (-) Transcript_80477:8-778(-)
MMAGPCARPSRLRRQSCRPSWRHRRCLTRSAYTRTWRCLPVSSATSTSSAESRPRLRMPCSTRIMRMARRRRGWTSKCCTSDGCTTSVSTRLRSARTSGTCTPVAAARSSATGAARLWQRASGPGRTTSAWSASSQSPRSCGLQHPAATRSQLRAALPRCWKRRPNRWRRPSSAACSAASTSAVPSTCTSTFARCTRTFSRPCGSMSTRRRRTPRTWPTPTAQCLRHRSSALSSRRAALARAAKACHSAMPPRLWH